MENLWKGAKSQYRNMVNKGRRETVAVQWNEPQAWQAFEAFYGRAMHHVEAPAALRFSHGYFTALRLLPGTELCSVQVAGRLAAASVFLFGPLWCHYHLAVRDPEAGNHIHSVILQSAIERACERGLQGMHMGGGRTTAPDDGLLRFKMSTGGQTIEFKVALVIADREKYQTLCHAWQDTTGRPPSWLLGTGSLGQRLGQPDPGGTQVSMERIKDISIHKGSSIREGMQAIDRGACWIAYRGQQRQAPGTRYRR